MIALRVVVRGISVVPACVEVLIVLVVVVVLAHRGSSDPG